MSADMPMEKQDLKRPHYVALLAAVLLLCAPPLLVGLKRADTRFHMEVITLLSSRETWVRQRAGEPNAWLVPTWNGRERIKKPPLAVWMNLAAWQGLDPATAAAEDLVFRARLAGAALAMIALLATAWTGLMLGGRSVSVVATAVTGTMLLFLRQARLASYDTCLLCFAAVAVALGLWAVRARRPWHALGWLLTGAAIGAAFMSKGPISLLFSVLPILLFIVLTPGRRWFGLLGLAAALAVAAAAAFPWYLYVLKHVPGAAQTLFGEYQYVGQPEYQPPWYYVGVLGLVFPWTLWFVAALVHPFRQRRDRFGRGPWPAWLWFVGLIVIMSIPAAKQQRYIVPLLPAAGILTAQYLMAYGRGARRAFRPWLARTHWTLLAVLSVVFFIFIAFQTQLIEIGWLRRPEVQGLGLPVAGLTMLLLLAIVIVGVSRQTRGRMLAAGLATAGWMVVAATVGFYGYVRSFHGAYRYRADAERVAETTAGCPIHYLVPESSCELPAGMRVYLDEPDQKFLFYSQRVIPPVITSELPDIAGDPRPVYVIVRAENDLDAPLKEQGFELVFDFRDGGRPRRLYRRPAACATVRESVD